MNSVNEILNNSNTGMKLIFFLHFVPTVWATQSFGLPIAYWFYNAFFLLSLFWALAHKDLEEPVFFAITINFVAIFLDAIIIGIYWPFEAFSFINAVFNVSLRPVTTIFLVRYYRERGDGQVHIPGLTTPCENQFGNRSSYESIDRQNDSTSGGVSFA